MTNYYETLGVNNDVTQEEIRGAFKKLAKRWHPDKNPKNVEEATTQFKKLGTAYEVLSDPEKRRMYDEDLASEDPPVNSSSSSTSASASTSTGHTYSHSDRYPDIRPDITLELVSELLNTLNAWMEKIQVLGRALCTEAQVGNWSNLDKYLQDNCSLVESGSGGNNVAHWAVFQNNLEALNKIIQHKGFPGANINLRNALGQTPLHIACDSGNYAAVQILLLYNADLTWQDRNGNTPLHLAIKNPPINPEENDAYTQIALMIIGMAKRKGPEGFFTKINCNEALNNAGESPLYLALTHQNYTVTYELYYKGTVKIDRKAASYAQSILLYYPDAHSSWQMLANNICNNEAEQKKSDCTIC
jgi:hypothetical protein